MTKTELCSWLTEGLTERRIVFINYGGSAHGKIILEGRDPQEEEDWEQLNTISNCNGRIEAELEEVDSQIHFNQFTGEVVEE